MAHVADASAEPDTTMALPPSSGVIVTSPLPPVRSCESILGQDTTDAQSPLVLSPAVKARGDIKGDESTVYRDGNDTSADYQLLAQALYFVSL